MDLELIRHTFEGNRSAHISMSDPFDKTTVKTMHERASDSALKNHFVGASRVGLMPFIDGTNQCKYGAWDIDTGEESHKKAITQVLSQLCVPYYTEISKTRGWHIWLFCDSIPAEKLRRFGLWVIEAAKMEGIVNEFFPKQVSPEKTGNGVWLPFFAIDASQSNGANRFIDKNGDVLDQEKTLRDARVVNESEVTEWIDMYSIPELAEMEAAVPEVNIKDMPKELPSSFTDRLSNDSKLKDGWDGRREPPGDKSRSGYDMMLACMLVHRQFSDGEIARILLEYSYGKESPGPHYLTHTIAKAKGWCAKNSAKSDSLSYQQSFSQTDDGNADRLVARHGDDLRYCPELGWLVWDGTRWAEDRMGEIRRRAVETIKSIAAEEAAQADPETIAALFKFAGKCLSDGRIKATISSAQSKLPLPVAITDFDTNPWLFNTQDGTIDLRTRKIRPHNRLDRLIKRAPVKSDSHSLCPHWLKFLDRIFDGNPDLIDFLQKAVGYSLTGSTAEECLFILYGTGANGKSTFLETIEALMGDYAMQTPTDTLMARKQDSQTNDIARLRGARFVSSVETEEGRRFAESKLKQLIGGDRVTARFLHKEFFEFTPEFKLWLACNHRPVIWGTDDGIWRRIRLIPFEVQIPTEEQDPTLKGSGGKLQSELSGILNWALEGCLKWQDKGLKMPADIRSATQGYRSDMDALGVFIEDCCYVNDKANVKARELYSEYSKWAVETGEFALSQRAFGSKLSERGFNRYRGAQGTHMWGGIGLHESPDGSNKPFGNS